MCVGGWGGGGGWGLYWILSLVMLLGEIFVTLFSLTVMPTKLKLGTHFDNGWMNRVYHSQTVAAYSFLYYMWSLLMSRDMTKSTK